MTIPRNENGQEGRSWIYCGCSVIIICMIVLIGGLFSVMEHPTFMIQLLLPSFSFFFPILIIGVGSSLYGIKKVTSLRKFTQRRRELLIFYCSFCSFLISITFVIYGYGSSTWCKDPHYSFVECHFRFSELSKVIIYAGFSLLSFSTFFIIYRLYQIRKILLKIDVLEGKEEKKEISANRVLY